MQENILTVAVIVLVCVLISEGIVIFQLFKLKKSLNDKNYPNERYFDLKLRIHSLQLTLIVVTSVIIFLGWNIKSQIISSIKTDINKQIQPDISMVKAKTDSIKSDYTTLNKELANKVTEINKLNKKYVSLSNGFNKINNIMLKKLEHLKTLLNIYVVPNLELDTLNFKPNNYDTKFYFKNLKPINASKLPIFKSQPIVNIQTHWGLGLKIVELTNNYIVVAPVTEILFTGRIELKTFTLWIIPNDKE